MTCNCFRFWSKLLIVQGSRIIRWHWASTAELQRRHKDTINSSPVRHDSIWPGHQFVLSAENSHLKKMFYYAVPAVQSKTLTATTAGRRLLIQPQLLCMAGKAERDTSAGYKNVFPWDTKVETSNTRAVFVPNRQWLEKQLEREERSVWLNNCQRTELHFPAALRRNIRQS